MAEQTCRVGDVDIAYETFGDPSQPALLLVMGLATQMIAWHDDFCAELAGRGFHVIRFDNRDVGRSTAMRDLPAPTVRQLALRSKDAAGYTLSDMAGDAVGLLDHLGIERAHVVGASMGGMIAQTIAIEHPQRCRSLISVMSSPGDPKVGQAAPEAMAVLLTPPPTERQAFIDAIPRYRIVASKKYYDEALAKERGAAAFDRSFYPQGVARQLAAGAKSGNRSEMLKAVETPTLVIHGKDDTLIQPSGGIRTAEVIPNATLLLLAHMGHDMPEPLWPMIVSAIVSHARIAG